MTVSSSLLANTFQCGLLSRPCLLDVKVRKLGRQRCCRAARLEAVAVQRGAQLTACVELKPLALAELETFLSKANLCLTNLFAVRPAVP